MKLRRSLAQSALTMSAAAAMASLVACAAGAEGTGSDDAMKRYVELVKSLKG